MSFRLFVTVYFIFRSQCGNATTLTENKPIYNMLKGIDQNDNALYTECLQNIISNNFENYTIRLMVSSFHNLDSILKPIHHQLLVTLTFIHSSAWNFNFPYMYIFLARDITDLESSLKNICTHESWKPAAKIIVILENIREDNNLLREIFAKLMNFNIYNVIVLVKTTTAVNIYTYFPFGNNKCGRKFDNVINLGNCAQCKEMELFPDISDGLKNCTLVVLCKDHIPSIIDPTIWDYKNVSYHEGFEQYILKELALLEGIALQYKYVYNDVPNGDILSNGTTTGMFMFLQNGTADIIAGSLSLSLSRANHFEYVWGYDFINVVLFTSSEFKNDERKIHLQFSGIIWFLILCSYFIICILTILIYDHSPDQPHDYVKLMFKLYGYFLGHTDKHMFKQKRLKLLLISWIWLGMFITNLYTALVSSTMILKSKPVRNFSLLYKELDKIFLEPCVYEDMIKFYEKGRNSSIIKGKMKPECLDKRNALNIVANTKGMYTFTLDYDFDYVQRGSNIDIRKISTDLGFSISTLYTKKGFVLNDRFNKHVVQMFESGLVKRHLNYLHAVYGNKESVKKPTNEFNAYKLHDIITHFKILLCGYAVSVLCFIIERIKMKYLN